MELGRQTCDMYRKYFANEIEEQGIKAGIEMIVFVATYYQNWRAVLIGFTDTVVGVNWNDGSR